jgi:large subunit ribosomal protein L3
LGYVECAEKKLNKPQLGVFKKAGLKPYKFIKEFFMSGFEGWGYGDSREV